MADELTRNRITIQQTLHGYSEGHRFIIGSTKLAQQDARVMLVLSDSSGSGAKIPSAGYLTGYPLTGPGKYVLARTWSAPEMSRPGCVWTHSLLMDFADLGRLSSAGDLVRHLRRPSGSAYSSYSAPLDITISPCADQIVHLDSDRVAQWLEAIYRKPRSKVVALRDSIQDDEFVLALWMQQWPRLRRAFRFCTLAVDDRSMGGDIFDLQLIHPSSRSRRSSLPDTVLASSISFDPAVAALIHDLRRPDGTGLRRFLREVGGDVSNGRAAMLPLTHLFAALDPNAKPESIAEAVHELEHLGPGQGRIGRAAAAKLVLSRPDEVDQRLFQFALEQLRSNETLMDVDPEIVGRAILKWHPEAFGDALKSNDALRTAVNAALPSLKVEELTSALSQMPDAFTAILPARPDLLESPDAWRIQHFSPERLLAKVNLAPEQAGRVVSAMIVAHRGEGAEVAVQRFGIRPIIRAVEAGDDRLSGDILRPWMRAVAARPGEVAACLTDGTLQSRRMLILLVPFLDPDVVPNDFGEDPWVTAVHSGRTTADVAGEDNLAAFLFCRAMGWRSKSAGRLLSLSVERLHEALAAGRVLPEAWRLIEQRLPWVIPWGEWDRCERLRKAVVDRFVDANLPPIEFGTVVDSQGLWARLVDIAADSSRGRRYLERVGRCLRDGSEEGWRERARTIERKIR
jgi:hypothetical protein